MGHSLEDRIYYELPLNHIDFDNIRKNICIYNDLITPEMEVKTEDETAIIVTCYRGEEIESMNNLVEVL